MNRSRGGPGLVAGDFGEIKMSDLIVTVLNSNIRTRKLDSGNTMLLQKMQLEQSGDYPVVFESVVEAPMAAGRYVYTPSFKNNQFGGLELNRYEMNLRPIQGK